MSAFATILSVDRVGKGIRTAPRDALISLTSRPQDLASAFGVHRAMDTVGVLVGPLLAFWILASMPGRFDAVFVISFAVALIGLAVLVLLVDDRRGAAGDGEHRASLDLPGLLRNRPFVSIAGVAALTSFVVVSDAFLYLLLQWRRGGGAEAIPLLYAGTAGAYLVLAAPLGLLADRIGRARCSDGAGILDALSGVAWGGDRSSGRWMLCLVRTARTTLPDGVIAALVAAPRVDVVPAAGRAHDGEHLARLTVVVVG